MTYQTAPRTAIPQLRRWCPYAKTHQDADYEACEWDYCRDNQPGPHHKLRLRRMLVCSTCQQGYFTQGKFDAHECGSAY